LPRLREPPVHIVRELGLGDAIDGDVAEVLVQHDNFDEKSATIWMRIWCRAVVMIAAKNGARKRKV
jgi:hypothetical protein